MGRPGLTRHRKFKRLARTLDGTIQAGFGSILARGVLESMWDAAYENGDDFLGDAMDVAALTSWGGKPDSIVAALLDAGGEGHPGFIEECERPGTYRIHDLFDHMPDYVERRLKREIARNEKGQTITSLRSAAGKKGAANRKNKATGEQVDGNRPANGGRLLSNGRSASDGNEQTADNGAAGDEQLATTPAPARAPARAHAPAPSSVHALALDRSSGRGDGSEAPTKRMVEIRPGVWEPVEVADA